MWMCIAYSSAIVELKKNWTFITPMTYRPYHPFHLNSFRIRETKFKWGEPNNNNFEFINHTEMTTVSTKCLHSNMPRDTRTELNLYLCLSIYRIQDRIIENISQGQNMSIRENTLSTDIITQFWLKGLTETPLFINTTHISVFIWEFYSVHEWIELWWWKLI